LGWVGLPWVKGENEAHFFVAFAAQFLVAFYLLFYVVD